MEKAKSIDMATTAISTEAEKIRSKFEMTALERLLIQHISSGDHATEL